MAQPRATKYWSYPPEFIFYLDIKKYVRPSIPEVLHLSNDELGYFFGWNSSHLSPLLYQIPRCELHCFKMLKKCYDAMV